jgi:hypothetical protein
MLNILNNNKFFWIISAVLMLTSAMLAKKSSTSIMSIVSLRQDIVVGATAANRNYSPAMMRASYRDSMLTSLIAKVKDPFMKPEIVRKAAPVVAKAETSLPKLNILIFDGVAATAKLQIDEKTSGWLKVGDTYRSWQITSIDDKEVTVKRGSRVLVLN